MRKFLSALISLIMFFSTFSVGNLLVKAEDAHQFIIKAYDWNTFDNDWEGSGTGDELTQNSDVEPGRVIQVQLYYVPGSNPAMLLQMHMRYDDSLVEPMYYDDEFYAEVDTSTTYQGGMWPAKGTSPKDKLATNWVVGYNDAKAYKKITLEASDNLKTKPLVTEGAILTTYFKVKDDAPAGAVINFSFDEINTLVDQSDAIRPATYQNLTLNVFGKMSASATLNTLSVKSGNTTYDLSPTFTPDSSAITEYNVIVPNHVTSVDVSATPTDPSAEVANGRVAYDLPYIGNNDISLIVQAQNGSQEIYKLHIYRLNNDATLDTLTLTNDINIGVFNKEKTLYPVTVPYKTTSTIVNASQTDPNAEIISGLGTWELTNYGSNINTRKVVVNAENCKEAYETVPGNSCTSKDYQIDITRTAPSSNTNLSNLTIDGNTINGFTPTRETYDLGNLPYETETIDINAIVEDTGKATIVSELGTKNLNVGDNEVEIIVRAEDGTEKTYTIAAHRLSNNSNLASLIVTSDPMGTLTPQFPNARNNEYTYTAPASVETVTITATVEDIVDGVEKATIITGPGEYNIDDTDSVDIFVQAENGTQSTYTVKLVREKSNNAYLKSLSVDGYDLNEVFERDKKFYTVNVSGEVNKVKISAEVEDTGKARIVTNLDEEMTLTTYGENRFTIEVRAEDETPLEYYVTVIRAKKTISALTDLKVDGETVRDVDGTSFKESRLGYTLDKVPFEKSTVNISATVKDPDSTIVSGTGENIPLDPGMNELYVKVLAQDGVTQTTYTIKIEREKDSNAYLRELKIDGVSINLLENPPVQEFDKTQTVYGITVENNVTSLNIDATPDSEYISKDDIIISGNENFLTTESNLVTLTVTAPSGDFEIYRIHVTRKKSDNNYLKNIILSDGILDPVFDKMTNDYVVNVDRSVTSITIDPKVEDETSIAEVIGPDTLKIGGENIFTITVISEDSTKEPNVYTIKVNRLASNNNYLKSLFVDDVSINLLENPPVQEFDKTKPYYTISVPSDKTSVTIKSQTEEEHATINIGSEKTFDLESGTKTIEIEVKAENGEERPYIIVINKEKSNNSSLKDLHIVQAELNEKFEPSKTDYTANVDYNVTNVDIVAVLSDSRSTIGGDVGSDGTANVDLDTGTNEFRIIVISEDNTTTTYTLVVTRAKNNNANLSNIVLSDGLTLKEEFKPSVEEYSVDVPNQISTITITPHTQDSKATVAMQNDGQNISLTTSEINRIPIEVTAEDGETKKTYYVNITREKSNDNTLKELVVNGQKINLIPGKFKYEIEVNNEEDTLEVVAVPNSDSAPEDGIIIDSNKTLDVGTNVKTITVTAENGETQIYEITITRQPSSNNFLKTLSVKDENNNEYILNYNKTTKTYNIEVENDIDKLTFSGELDDSTSTAKGFDNEISMDENNTSFTIEKSIIVGNQSFEITVTSEDNIPRPYTINVFRKSNSNNYLSSLSVKDINNNEYITSFDKTNPTYPSINVDSDITMVNIIAVAEAETSDVKITNQYGEENFNLATGINTFNVKVTAENGESRPYIIIINRAASSNNYLSNLTVIPGNITPEFNKEELEYTINVDNATKKLTIDASTEHPAATIGENELGEKTINVGEQTFNITVTAEDKGTPRVYTIKVVREASSVNDLKFIKIDGELVEGFDKNKTEGYTINVDNSVDKVFIEADVLDETSYITSGTGYKELSTDGNTVVITVLAQDGTYKEYKLTIIRAKSSNSYLSSLTINDTQDYTPEFSRENEDYYITVPYEITTLKIDYTKEDEKATVDVDGNENFMVGENVVYINVTAENGSNTKSYKVHVTRQEQANNFLTSIIITGDHGVKYSLKPEFNKEQLTYDVELPVTISEVNIEVEKQESSLNVKGDGKVTISSLPQTQKVVVSAAGGPERVYTIIFKKGPSSNNKLTSIIVDKGKLEPVFTPGNPTYDVNLPSGTKDITITAIPGDDEQEITITNGGKIDLDPGRNIAHVIVLSGDRNLRIYTIVINVEQQNKDNVLSSLTVDKGTLSPEFNPNTNFYTVDLDEDEENIEINATGNNSITGTGLHTLDDIGANVFEIISTDDLGIENPYIVVVNRGNIISPYLKYLKVKNYDLKESFNKENKDYSLDIYEDITNLDVIAIPEDKNAIVTISGNENMTFGENNITITVTDENSNTMTYSIKVNIGNNKITSNIHTIDDKYISTIEENKTAIAIKGEMTNPIEYLKIYNLEGNEVLDTDIVGTGCVIKLVINGTEYDSKILVIKGDINGDGEVGVADIIKIRLHILETSQLNDIESIAADTNLDEDIGVADLVQIRSHILGNLNLYGKEEE